MTKNTFCFFKCFNKNYFWFSDVLKTKGAVQEIGGAEFKLSTQQCLPPFFTPLPSHLPSFLFPPPLSYPSLSSSTLFWLSVRGPTISFELEHRHPATIKLRAAPHYEIFRGHIQSVGGEPGTKVQHERDREYEITEVEAQSFQPQNCREV